MESNDDLFKIENQLCFPLYALSKEIVNGYRPFLDAVDLSYPQYLVMMLLWNNEKQTVSSICDKLYLDTGTVTPMLKRMEVKGYVTRKRSSSDERVVEVCITEKGKSVKIDLCEMHTKILAGKEELMEDMEQLKVLTDKMLFQLKNLKKLE